MTERPIFTRVKYKISSLNYFFWPLNYFLNDDLYIILKFRNSRAFTIMEESTKLSLLVKPIK